MQQKPRVVKRGLDEFDISDGEPEKVDHVLFLVHGIGKFCDLRFRPVTEVGRCSTTQLFIFRDIHKLTRENNLSITLISNSKSMSQSFEGLKIITSLTGTFG